MSRTVEAEYLARDRVLKLAEPLEGVRDHERIEIEIRQTTSQAEQAWMRLAGTVNAEDGRAIALTIRDAFGRDEIEV